MKRFLSACALGLLSLSAYDAAAQTVRQSKLVVDDGTGKLLTITAPAGMTAPGLTWTAPIPPVGNPASGFTYKGSAQGNMLFWDITGVPTPSDGAWTVGTNLNWDNTTGRMAIGSSSTTFTLGVTGTAGITGALTLGTGSQSSASTIVINDGDNSTSNAGTLTTANLSAPRTWTLPDANGTLSMLSASGTTDVLPKFSGPSSLGNSLLSDNGTTLSYNSGKFTVASANGNTAVAGNLTVSSAAVAAGDGQATVVRAKGASGAWSGLGAFGGTSATAVLGELDNLAQIGGHNATLGAWSDLYIQSSGTAKVRIGSETAPASTLDVTGTISADNTIASTINASGAIGPYYGFNTSVTNTNGGTPGNTSAVGINATATVAAGSDDDAVGGIFTANGAVGTNAIGARFSANGGSTNNAIEVTQGQVALLPTSNQIVLGTTKTTTLSATAPATSVTYTMPDAGADANFIMSESTGGQTINGGLTSGGTLTASGTLNVTGTSNLNGAVNVGNGDGDAIAINTTGNFSIASNKLNVSTGGAITGATGITSSGTITFSGLTAKGVLSTDASSNLVSTALTNGQLLVGSTGNVPVAATLTGTTNQISVANAAGSITLSTPQDIHTAATPTFASETLTATSNQLVLGTTRTATITAPTPAVASRTYTIPDPGADANFIMSTMGSTQTIAGGLTSSGTFTASAAANLNGNVNLGDAAADVVTVTGTVAGASPLVFDGATANANKTTLAITDPTGTNTITLQDASGNVPLVTSAGAAQFTGPTATRVYTLPDANATLLSTATGTTNTLPKYTSASALGDSKLTDNGTNLTYNSAFTVTTGGAVSGATGLSSSGTITFSGLTAKGVLSTDASSNLVSTALTNGQLLVGSTGNVPVAATLTGTTNQISVANAAGSITLSTPQNIHTAATPTFASETLTATSNQLVLGTTRTATITAPTPAVASRTYTIPDPGADANFIMSESTGGQTINGGLTSGGTLTASGTLNVTGTSNLNGAVNVGNGDGDAIAINTTGNFSIASNKLNVSTGGAITGATGITSSGTITFSGLTAKGVLSTDASSNLVSTALTDGQLLVGSSGNVPVATTLTGTTNQISVANAAGSITLSTPQNIHTAATPTFASETLTATSNQLVLGTTRTATITAPTPAVASRTYTIPDPGADANFIMSTMGSTQTIAGGLTSSGTFTASAAANLNGNVNLGDAAADVVTVTGTIAGASPLVFEGTAGGGTTTLSVGNPAGTNTISLQDVSGSLAMVTTAGGAAQFTGPTATHTYALPDADATLLTTATGVAYGSSNNSLASGITSLFDVSYAALTNSSAVGATITSQSDATAPNTGQNAIGLTINAIGEANGSGTATSIGLNVSATGGTTNYAIDASNGDIHLGSGGLAGAGVGAGTNSFAERVTLTGDGATQDFAIANTKVAANSVIIVTVQKSSTNAYYTPYIASQGAGTFSVHLSAVPAAAETVKINYMVIN